jgi:hypothetical protein
MQTTSNQDCNVETLVEEGTSFNLPGPLLTTTQKPGMENYPVDPDVCKIAIGIVSGK